MHAGSCRIQISSPGARDVRGPRMGARSRRAYTVVYFWFWTWSTSAEPNTTVGRAASFTSLARLLRIGSHPVRLALVRDSTRRRSSSSTSRSDRSKNPGLGQRHRRRRQWQWAGSSSKVVKCSRLPSAGHSVSTVKYTGAVTRTHRLRLRPVQRTRRPPHDVCC
jgi:hypothetical protein